MRIKGEPLDLALVLDAALDIVRPAADAKGVSLHRDFDHGPAPLVGDADRLQQVFWNLLSNAVKFTPRGGRVIVRLAAAESHFVVEVEDSGQGIPSDFLPHVFQRFRQHDLSSTRKAGGLGLGLAIVRHLVELHGGQVDVASEGQGRGSTLTVRLPIHAALRPASSEPASVVVKNGEAVLSTGAATHLSSLRGLRVLVVDDDADARELIATVLGMHQVHATAMASAREALERLQAEPHDLLISDIGMPIEDGYMLMERVRALPPAQGGRIPAIALTAFAHNTDRAKALLAGYTAHATKPIDPAELVLIIRSIIGARNP
jgi:CheY-like chemotaxis protein